MSSRPQSRTLQTTDAASVALPTVSRAPSRAESIGAANLSLSRFGTRIVVDTVEPLLIDTLEARNECALYFTHERNLANLFHALTTELVLERPSRPLLYIRDRLLDLQSELQKRQPKRREYKISVSSSSSFGSSEHDWSAAQKVNDTRATMPSTATEILHDLLGALDPEKHVEPLHPSRNPLHMHLRGELSQAEYHAAHEGLEVTHPDVHAKLQPPVLLSRPRPGIVSIDALSDERERERLQREAQRERELRAQQAARSIQGKPNGAAKDAYAKYGSRKGSATMDKQVDSSVPSKEYRLTSGGLQEVMKAESKEQPQELEQQNSTSDRGIREVKPRPTSLRQQEISFLTEISTLTTTPSNM